MATKLIEMGEGLELWKVNVDELIEQDVNAHVMPPETFTRLAKTIERDKRLESLALCATTARGVEIISGHHRIRAARTAGVIEVFVLVDVTGLTPDQIKAKQLAHNKVIGMDDETLVAQLYASIGDVQARLESHVDPATLGKVKSVSIPDVALGIDYRSVVIMFLPYERQAFEKAAEAGAKVLGSMTDEAYLAEIALLPLFQQVMKRVGKSYNVRSLGAIFAKFGELLLQHLGEDHDGDPDWTALRDVVGADYVPAAAANVMAQAINVMVAAGEVSEKAKWQAFELLCADRLAGV